MTSNQDLSHLARKIGLRLLPLGLFAMLAGAPALAQNCSVIGNSIICDNGLSGQRAGNFTNWSDGTSLRNVSASPLQQRRYKLTDNR